METSKCLTILDLRKILKSQKKNELNIIFYLDRTEWKRWTQLLFRFLRANLTHNNQDEYANSLVLLSSYFQGDDVILICKNIVINYSCHNPLLLSLLYTYCKEAVMTYLSNGFTVSIIIPTYNRDKRLECCIVHYVKMNLPFLSIDICDNASTDQTQSTVNRLQAEYASQEINYSRSTTNVGWLKNYYLALSRNNSDVVVFGTDDDLLSEHMIIFAALFYNQNPDHGLLLFANDNYSRINRPKEAIILGTKHDKESIRILKSIGPLGGIVLSKHAIHQSLHSFPTDFHLLGHIDLCVNIAQNFPSARINCSSYDPKINALSQIANTSGQSTSPNDLIYLKEMMQSNILDHEVDIKSFRCSSISLMLYSAPCMPDISIRSAIELQDIYYQFFSKWQQSWIGHRLRTIGENANLKDTLFLLFRLIDIKNICHMEILTDIAFILDRRNSILDNTLHNLFSVLLASIVKLKLYYVSPQGKTIANEARKEILIKANLLSKNIQNDAISVLEAETIFDDMLEPIDNLVLNTHPEEFHHDLQLKAMSDKISKLNPSSKPFNKVNDLLGLGTSIKNNDLNDYVGMHGAHQLLRFSQANLPHHTISLLLQVISEMRFSLLQQISRS